MLTVGVGVGLMGSTENTWILISQVRECIERDIKEVWRLLSLAGMAVVIF